MSDYNDSFDEKEFMTIEELKQCGRNIGATHVIFSYEVNDPHPYVTFVMPHEDADTILERCEGGCPSNELVYLGYDPESEALS